MKKFLIILIIIFICGILSADVCLKEMKENSVFLEKDFYEQYAHVEKVFKNVFWHILYERTKIFFVLLIICFTPLKEKIGILLLPIFSYIWGFYLMSCIVELGGTGVVVGLASVLPHGILYGIAMLGMIEQGQTRGYHRKNLSIMHVARYMFVILLFVTACVVESLVGSRFIPWIIRLGFI